MFSLLRLDRITDYLNEMRKKGYKLIKIKHWCVFVFQYSKIKDDFKYTILTEHYCFSSYFKQKWNDIEFLEKRNSRFHKGNGEQCDYLAADVWCHIYLTRLITDEDISALNEYRKKHILKCQMYWIGFLLLLFASPVLFYLYLFR